MNEMIQRNERNEMKLQQLIFACLIPILLSGCASMNSTFDCPKSPGVTCASLDQVNTMVNRGELGNINAVNCPTCVTSHCNKPTGLPVPTSDFNTPYPIQAINPCSPMRLGETVMRVWVAPYQDTQGNYYQPSILYTVVKSSHWVGSPVTAISNDEDD